MIARAQSHNDRMLKRLASLTFLLFFFPSVWGATYYVATNGNNSAVGDISHPWLTIGYSFTQVAAGNTVKVGPGVYAETGDTGLSYTGASGTSNAPITFDGQGAAYITKWWFAPNVQYIIIKGFHVGWNYWSTYQMGGFGIGAHHCQYLSNYFRAMGVGQSGNSEGGVGWGQGSVPWGTNDASYCLVQGNVFENFTGIQCLGIAGDNNLIQYNVFRDCPAPEAAIYIWGRTNTIRGNLFTNLWDYAGEPGHPDIFQTFGDNGYGAQDILIEGNYVINCSGQIGSLQSATAAGENATGYITNNAVSFTLTNSAPIPGTVASPMKVFPNYLRVSTNSCVNYVTVDDGVGGISGYGFTGTVDYTNGIVALNYTAADGFRVDLCYDWQRVCPYVTNWVFRNNVIVNVGSPLHVTLPGFQMLNNTFYQCAWSSDLGFAVTWNKSINGNADNGVIANNVFLLCGNNAESASVNFGWYAMSGPLTGMVIENNYLGGENWGAKNPILILGTNIINGGDPKLYRAWAVQVTNLYDMAAQSATNFDRSTWSNRYQIPDLHPFASSPLVGAGTNLSSRFTNDFDGNTRPGSGAWTIGAYEPLYTGRPAPPRTLCVLGP
jgi:hypothetical protein